MNIIESLRRCFTFVARNSKRRQPEAGQPSTVADLLARINDIESFYAPPLQKNVRANPSGYNVTFDWMCLLADRVGPAAGVRTLFRLYRLHGSGVQVASRSRPETSMGHSSPTDIEIVLPLEKLLPEMAAFQARQKASPGVTPCPIVFDDRVHFDEIQELVQTYRRQQPRDTNILKLVK